MANGCALFNDAGGHVHRVCRLNQDIARERANELLKIHNIIPNQHWELEDLLANRDETRIFHAKWEISSIAFAPNDSISGFCIGFEREPDRLHYFEKCFYLHRLAVSEEFQGLALGALLQTQTIVNCFIRGFLHVGGPFDQVVLYGQTDLAPSNRKALLFHKAAGFNVVGEKPYDIRTDAIMRMTAQTFWRSRHVAIWRRSHIRT